MKLQHLACLLFAALAPVAVSRAEITLTFEGLHDMENVLNAYNGGTGGAGTSLTNYGISFSSNALALIDSDAGGSGNISFEPSGETVLFFLQGSATTLNFAAGFDTGFSFYYAAPVYGGSIRVYDGLDGTGNLLASLDLATTAYGPGDPNGQYSVLNAIGVGFEGTARSVDFGGTANYVVYDNITFGSVIPGNGNGNTPVPEPSTYGLVGAGLLLGLVGLRRRFQKRA